MSNDDRSFVIRTAMLTLAVIIVSMVGVLLVGLFDSRVDNNEIFKVIGPSFGMIIGGLVSLVSSLITGRKDQ